VLVVAGQHGTEESGRSEALELIAWLASGGREARRVLGCHEIAVVPCANPDGAVHGTYRNAEDVDVAHTYSLGAPAGTPEGRCLEEFALPFAPEVVVDIHGRAGGGMKDTVWLSRPPAFTPDRHYLTVMALEMCRAAEEAGFPQAEVQPPGSLGPAALGPAALGPAALGESDRTGLTLGEKMAAEVKSLGFGVETIEHYYREPQWRADGLARLRRLLRFGCEDAFGLGEPGYPASVVSGSRICALKAHGRTAARRRESRVELSRFLGSNWAIVDRGADGLDGYARVKIFSKTVDGDNPERFAVLLRIKKPCRVRAVTWQGEALAELAAEEGGEDGDGDHGFSTWEDGISVLVQANIARPFGGGGPERVLEVRYDSPFLT